MKFIGVGKRSQDLEPFYPDWMASCILGMGDMISLVERASTEVNDANAARMREKMAKAKFDFDNFMAQSELVSSMGSLVGVAKMLPGLGNMIDNSQLRTFFLCLFRGERAMPREWHSSPSSKR
jgi:signal recognition particle subunit SRP54